MNMDFMSVVALIGIFVFIYKIVEVTTKNKKDKKDNSEERSR